MVDWGKVDDQTVGAPSLTRSQPWWLVVVAWSRYVGGAVMVDSWMVARRNRAFVVGGTKVLAGAAKQVSAGKQPLDQDQHGDQDQVAAQPGDQVPEQPGDQG